MWQYKQIFLIQPKISSLSGQFADAINECYNNKIFEKATIQIKK